MLRINLETDYAVRVILALAEYPAEEIIPSAIIRKKMLLPESLSLQIVSRLAHQNLIKTFPGRNGGIQLARPPAEISLHDVVNAMEGPITLSDCLGEGHICQLAPSCPVQGYWKNLQSKIVQDMKETDFLKLSQTNPQLSYEIVK
jgi:Rrf2 family protein